MLITLEGGDGAGKSSQIPVLADWIEKVTGHEVVRTKEPGGTPLGAKFRELLLSDKEGMHPAAELLLLMADRAQHVQTVITPALLRGSIVICDRYIDSTIAYQGFGRRNPLPLLRQLNSISTNGLMPHCTLLFDVSIDTGLARATVKTKFEGLGREFQQRILDGFRAVAWGEPERVRVIDANQDFESVTRQAQAVLAPILGLR